MKFLTILSDRVHELTEVQKVLSPTLYIICTPKKSSIFCKLYIICIHNFYIHMYMGVCMYMQ